jgi:hypothetical protein
VLTERWTSAASPTLVDRLRDATDAIEVEAERAYQARRVAALTVVVVDGNPIRRSRSAHRR